MENIPHKKIVKYLGVFIDERFKFNKHVEIVLDKAKKAFLHNKNIFYSAKLKARVKIICYMLLIRLILTYGCQIWYGIAPMIMEKLRVFERSYLRVCLGAHRSQESDYKRYI